MRRKKVPVGPNLQCPIVEGVMAARQCLAIQETEEAARQVRYDVTLAVRELTDQSLESLQFEWQIDCHGACLQVSVVTARVAYA
jgi:hypothetical protein